MNYMTSVAELLGINLGEEFKVDKDCTSLKLTKKGLYYYDTDENCWRETTDALKRLLTGEEEVVREEFKPKMRETYWFAEWDGFDVAVDCNLWTGDDIDYQRFNCGNCFRTCEEAEDTKYKVYSMLTGKRVKEEWEE